MLRFVIAALAVTLAGSAMSEPSDPHAWLEDWHGEKSMAWVKAENAKTLGVLEADPRFAGLVADALKVSETPDRIPTPGFRRGAIYNFWQDAAHVRGLWRRTSLADYTRPSPEWETVLDLDVLAKAENANWVYKGVDCEWRDETRCLLHLSDGGEDAVTVREFDLGAKAFVEGGFVLPKGKQNIAWADKDTLLVAREWTPGDLTASGYPFIVRTVKRGQALADAPEIFRGQKSDVLVAPATLHDGDGHSVSLIVRAVTFFETETWIMTPAGLKKLGIPAKAEVSDLVAGRLVITLKTDWRAGDVTYTQGSLVAVDLAAALADPVNLKPTLVFAPGPRQAVENVGAAKSKLYVEINDNVKGRVLVFTPEANQGWSHTQLGLPDNAAIHLVSADSQSNKVFLSVTGFLDPASLWLFDGDQRHLAEVKTTPPLFDAAKDVVEQREAVSTDGTKIPYFIVHPKGMALNGANPTILTAYGGFQVSRTPDYSPVLGKLWLERGGVYVLANIRGGGEFGPAWHEAGLKTKRQIIYDDFAAVARDLVARRVTSPRRLGIQGGSNGGLLMGVEMTQHPDLFRAVDIAVPLLDMINFEHIAAGASWVGEYGSMSNPDERAFWEKTSPYQNLKAGVDYPEALIWTTTKDDRVGPQHARKFAARLAELGRPYLFYEVIEGGHGAGANLKQAAHTNAVQYVYFLRKLVD
jgi:prolyl oligopeptidase